MPRRPATIPASNETNRGSFSRRNPNGSRRAMAYTLNENLEHLNRRSGIGRYKGCWFSRRKNRSLRDTIQGRTCVHHVLVLGRCRENSLSAASQNWTPSPAGLPAASHFSYARSRIASSATSPADWDDLAALLDASVKLSAGAGALSRMSSLHSAGYRSSRIVVRDYFVKRLAPYSNPTVMSALTTMANRLMLGVMVIGGIEISIGSIPLRPSQTCESV